MPDYSALRDKKNQLIRKALDGSVFIAPESADAIETLTTTGGALAALPSGYADLGHLTDDGVSFGRDVSTSDTTSWGSSSPTRSDIVSDTTTLGAVCQETNMQTLQLSTGAVLTTSSPGTNGEVKIDKPIRPSTRYYRVLALAVDTTDDGEIYVARFLPRAKVTDYAEQKFAKGDDGITYGVTFTGFEDSELGTAESYFFGGPGWSALLSDMGFTPAG